MNVAHEGLPFIGGASTLAAAAIVVALVTRAWPAWLAAALLTAIAIWVVFFFRDPERTGPRGEGLVVAPADGRIVMITEVPEPAFIGGRATRISIFMNIFSVHVNRYPVSGTVTYLDRKEGKFLSAQSETASIQNEQNSVGIETSGRKVLTRQIAGLIARRIVTYSHRGELVRQGERLGLIRFGSRVDVFVPARAVLRVKLGDQPVAGSTVLAELP